MLRYLDGHADPPTWVERLVVDWQRTLVAMEQDDFEWLSARLDAFAKYRLSGATLRHRDCEWKDLRGRSDLFYLLALLHQSYHEFTSPDSVFGRLEEAGALQHRVGPLIEPGQEAEPFVPRVDTRARARARFIRAHGGDENLRMGWQGVFDVSNRRRRSLVDPFAEHYGRWKLG